MYSLVSNPSFLLWSMFSLTHNQQLDLLDEKSSKVMKTMKKADKEDSLLKKDESSVTMDVADLSRGTYYLHLTFSDKKVEK